MNNSVDIFLNKKLIVLKENDSAISAAKAMCINQVNFIVVNSYNSGFKAIITDRDLVFFMIINNLDIYSPLKIIIKDTAICLNKSSVIGEAINLMKKFGAKHIPVLEKTKTGVRECIGIVTLEDLVAGEFIPTKDLSQIVKTQIINTKKISRIVEGESGKLENIYMKFISRISIDINLERVKTTEVTKFFLSTLVKRLYYSAGVHLISQLPKYLHEYLLSLKPGPDSTISDKTIIQGISLRTGKDIVSSRLIAQRFWKSLVKTLGPGEADHILNQLPDSIKNLFQSRIRELQPYSITGNELKEHAGG